MFRFGGCCRKIYNTRFFKKRSKQLFIVKRSLNNFGIVPVTLGGTGSNTAPMVAVITAADPAAARAVLEIDKAGTDNSAVTLANVANNYLSLNGQEITSGIVPVTLGGTGFPLPPWLV